MTVVEYPGAAQGKRTSMVVCAWVSAAGEPQQAAYPAIALEFLVTAESTVGPRLASCCGHKYRYKVIHS